MKRKILTAVAAAFAAAAIPAFAQDQGESAPAGLSEDQAIELARIVNAAGDETKDAIATVVKDVFSNAEDPAAIVDELAASLAAAVVAQGGKDVVQHLADIVAAISAAAPGDASSAFAERAAATISTASGISSFSELVPEELAESVADAIEDPLSVVTAKEVADNRALYTRIYEILTPDTYTMHSDNDAHFLLGNGSGKVGPGGMAAYGKLWIYGPDGSIVLLHGGSTPGGDNDKPGKKPDDSKKPPKKPVGPTPRPSPTPTGRR